MSVIEELPRSRDRFEVVAIARWLLVAVIGLGTLLVTQNVWRAAD